MKWGAIGAAIALAYRASPRLLAGQLVLELSTAALTVGDVYLTKLLFDELARGTSLDVARAVWLAVAGAVMTASLVAAGRLNGYLVALHRRALGLTVEDELYRRVNQIEGIAPFEDPGFLGRLRLAEQASLGAPGEVASFALTLVRSSAEAAGLIAVAAATWAPMPALLVAAGIVGLFARLALARSRAAAVETTTEAMRRRFFFRSLLTDVRAAKEIRLFGLGPLFHRRMLETTRRSTGPEARIEAREAAVQIGLALLCGAVACAGTVVAILGVASGHMTLGDLALFIAAIAGTQGAISAVVEGLGGVSTALRLLGHYTDVMAPVPEPARARRTAPPLESGIELRDVWFRYAPDAPWVLRGVDLTIPRGRALGVVGVNGAGKSTLVKLLCRFYEPERGEIVWDGVPLGELTAEGLRRRICAVFQDFMTYDLSAAENVGLGAVGRLDDLAGVRRAARLADIDAELSVLPRGYQTLLSSVYFDEDGGQRGAALSGGQWQRVALARALFRDDADLLILDEPSAGLDPDAEHRIHRVLARHRAGRTSLLISHRLSAIRDADTIAVLHDGRVTERGSHDDLMAAGGSYARLFGLQSAGYRDRKACS